MRPDAALALLERLAATPRAAGSAEEEQARRVCAEFLEAHGFETRDVAFSYSSMPGRWGVPLVGAIWFAAGAAAVYAGARLAGAVAAGIAFGLIVVGGMTSFALSRLVSGGRFGRSEGVNLVATRGNHPVIWLCAHLDTKSQAVSTFARTGTLLAAGASAVTLALLQVSRIFAGGEPGLAWIVAGTALASASGVMMASVVGNASPGAADNASGVVAVLMTAAGTDRSPLGVVLTSAEELGLAGAKAWSTSAVSSAQERPRLFINCDTLDDEGVMRCVVHRGRDRGIAADLAAAGTDAGIRMRITRHTPGIMVDSAAAAARGLAAVTLSRVSSGTLRRIHTPRDTADRLSGDGVRKAAAIMTTYLRGLA